MPCISGIKTSLSIVQNRSRNDLFTLLMLKCGSVVKEHFSIATLAYNKDGRCYPLQYCTFIWVLSCHTKVSWYDMFFLTGLIVMETLRYVLLKFQFIQKSNVGVSKKCYVIFLCVPLILCVCINCF